VSQRHGACPGFGRTLANWSSPAPIRFA